VRVCEDVRERVAVWDGDCVFEALSVAELETDLDWVTDALPECDADTLLEILADGTWDWVIDDDADWLSVLLGLGDWDGLTELVTEIDLDWDAETLRVPLELRVAEVLAVEVGDAVCDGLLDNVALCDELPDSDKVWEALRVRLARTDGLTDCDEVCEKLCDGDWEIVCDWDADNDWEPDIEGVTRCDKDCDPDCDGDEVCERVPVILRVCDAVPVPVLDGEQARFLPSSRMPAQLASLTNDDPEFVETRGSVGMPALRVGLTAGLIAYQKTDTEVRHTSMKYLDDTVSAIKVLGKVTWTNCAAVGAGPNVVVPTATWLDGTYDPFDVRYK